MKIKRIAHLGVAIKDLDPPKKLYGANLNLEHKGDEVVSTQKVQVSFFKVGETPPRGMSRRPATPRR